MSDFALGVITATIFNIVMSYAWAFAKGFLKARRKARASRSNAQSLPEELKEIEDAAVDIDPEAKVVVDGNRLTVVFTADGLAKAFKPADNRGA